MADMHDNYSPTEGERLHRLAMLIGSNRLRDAIREKHPRIVSALGRKGK